MNCKIDLIKELMQHINPGWTQSKTIFVANSNLFSATLAKEIDCSRLSGLVNLEDKNVQRIIKDFKEFLLKGIFHKGHIVASRITLATSFAYACLPELLEDADYLIFAQYPLDQPIYRQIKELAKIHNVKVINPVLLGTFEEEAVNILDSNILSKGLL